MITLAADRAYRLWAPSYSEETAISLLDEELATELSPPVTGKRLLDAGCGTGRRLIGLNAGLAIGADICREMLMAGGQRRVAVADVRSLPFPAGFFDVIWCRLVLGHMSDPMAAYRELARVCCAGGFLFVSDFHPDAVAAGHRRSFRDSFGTVFAVEHHVHDISSHVAMAAEAGLATRAQRAGRVGSTVERLYAQADRMPAYEKDFGLPVVAAFLFQRTADAPAHRSQECDNRD